MKKNERNKDEDKVKNKLEEKDKPNPVIRVPNFVKYYVTNIDGGLTEHDFRFELMNEKLKEGKKWCYVSDAMVILSPIGAKRLLCLLNELVNEYEKENGSIDIDIKEDKVY
ncbi:DUF3467 domain-containing protein [Candidatus Woesearchaeota archaeon]|nr:DUF3467 domain-containing protein [Candidatus Woesearchaeota archaeon]